ncbi:SMP-30/gluconolactonase/LRE family protein [Variovorax humicola]|uniref:SMP-30/gluconolactonase/LRE family protein n=1 Tax=Variovorax humicola TaxID=1769758 RepID=A0ABU8W5S2_9BURK
MWQTLSNSQCELGESPFWHPAERSLYWVDIPGRAVLRTRGDIGVDVAVERWALAEEPGCIAPAKRGGLVMALRSGIYRAKEWGGALQSMVAADYDTATMRFNDGKCDALGRFWAGTLNEPKTQRNATLYCLDARGGRTPVVTKKANEALTANGLGFAPDGGTLYWSDTGAHVVRAWDWAAEVNTLSRERVFRQFDLKPDGWTSGSGVAYQGRPDGATVDAAGDYWAAMFEGAQLLRLTPHGEQREAVALPVQCPTMPCFGGDDLRTLFVTSGRKGRPAAELERLPASGSVLMRRMEAQGLPVSFFDD